MMNKNCIETICKLLPSVLTTKINTRYKTARANLRSNPLSAFNQERDFLKQKLTNSPSDECSQKPLSHSTLRNLYK